MHMEVVSVRLGPRGRAYAARLLAQHRPGARDRFALIFSQLKDDGTFDADAAKDHDVTSSEAFKECSTDLRE